MTEHDPADCGLRGVEAGLMPEVRDLILRDQSPASPLRSLDWRWIVATYLARTGSRTRLRWVDGPVRRAARFLRRSDRPATPGRSGPPGMDMAIAGALALRSGPACSTRTAAEALLLAGLEDLAIASEVGLDPSVVAAYADLFYDVRPLLGHPDAVLAKAFGHRLYDQVTDTGLAVRLLAFAGGPVVARALVEAAVLPSSTDDTGDHGELVGLLDEYRLAWSLPVDGRSAQVLLGLHTQAEQFALDGVGRTVASVTRPLSIAGLDARLPAGPGDPVRAAGPIGPPEGVPVRIEGARGGAGGGPGEVEVAGPTGLPEGGVRLGLAG